MRQEAASMGLIIGKRLLAMRLASGIILVFLGIIWIIWISKRETSRRAVLQTLFDFWTGAPIESVMVVGIILFGGILIFSHFLL
jgi:hypothetical protein